MPRASQQQPLKACVIVGLQAMRFLQQAIRLRGYAQRDPLVEYKLEGYDLFLGMMAQVIPLQACIHRSSITCLCFTLFVSAFRGAEGSGSSRRVHV